MPHSTDPCLTSRHDCTDYLEEMLRHHTGFDGYGGASDVDSLIMRRTFLSTGTPQTEENRWYVLQNWRQGVSVILDEAGVQRERAHRRGYHPQALHRPRPSRSV